MSETTNMAITTMGITRINFPMTPVTNMSGIKATIVVRTEKTTGTPTSKVPSMAALSLDFPLDLWS